MLNLRFLIHLTTILLICVSGAMATPTEKQRAAVLYNEGLRALERKDHETAFKAFKQAVSLDASLSNAHYALGMLHKEREAWKAASRSFQATTDADPNHIEAYCELGEVYLEALAQPTEAARVLKQAVALAPKHPRARRLLGTVYLRENRSEAAIGELRHAIELKPDDEQACYTLGMAYLQQNRFDAAIDRFRQAIELNPFHAQAHFSLGNSYLRVGKSTEGQAALQTFQKLNQEAEQLTHLKRLARQYPQRAEVWYQLGQLQMKREEWESATTAFEKCISLEPKRARGYEARGYIYYQRGNYEDALEMYKACVQHQPDNATYRNGLGGMYLMLKQYQEAVKQYQAAIRLDPSEARFYLHLSKAHELAGNRAKADEAQRRYEQLK
jgi:tetratricopeptide (TPR) repeat protein